MPNEKPKKEAKSIILHNYHVGDIKIASMLDTRRETKEGYPVKIRVNFKRDRKYYATGKNLSVADWNKLPSTSGAKLIDVKKSIAISFDLVKACVDNLFKDDLFSFDTLNKRLGNTSGESVNKAYKNKIEGILAEDKIETSNWYKYSLRSVALFAGDNIQFDDITVEWLKRFEKHLLADNKSYTTISMYMRALQVIVNEAKTSGIVKAINHPFGKGRYEIPQHSGRNMSLTLSEVGKLVKFECQTKNMEKCRDIWFFSYLCNGANITDILKLKFSNIANGEISFYRQKTLAKSKIKKQIHATILPEMESIIERWGNKPTTKDSLIFPFLKGGESAIDERRIIKNATSLINKNIKKVGAKIGIPKISTYTARHSFATVLKRSGANIASIAESLGHSDVKTTENYLDQFESEERMKNAKSLTNF